MAAKKRKTAAFPKHATARGLPFFAMPARILVRRAIANVRKESQRAAGPHA